MIKRIMKKITPPTLLIATIFSTYTFTMNINTITEKINQNIPNASPIFNAMAPGIALNLVSGVIAELIYPFPRHQWAALDPVHPFVATIAATLGGTMTWYNLEKSGHFRLLPMALPAFVFGIYFYCIAVDGTKYAKNKFLAWYNRHKHPNKTIL